ncbi:PRTRC system protein B [Sphingobacterium siyangense]|uniref:PRTRC system protein B n=1 Tax=Sphingobacterium siyangense TaxID=459529 RepID=UPI003DA46FE5
MEEEILSQLGSLYYPVSALLVYTKKGQGRADSSYVEHYDIDEDGKAINAHPLTIQETSKLIRSLKVHMAGTKERVLSKEILPANLLYVNNDIQGPVIWYTQKTTVPLFFTERLGIPTGMASVPAMVWKVTGKRLSVFALASDKRPTAGSLLYNAPFFNIHPDGSVCLGTVDTKLDHITNLQDWMCAWQDFFFNSRFSHLLSSPVNGNCVHLWKSLVETGKPFPKKVLIPTTFTLTELLKA